LANKPPKYLHIELPETKYVLLEADYEMYKLHLNGPKLRWAIDEFISESLRKRLKYGSLSEAQHRLITEIRDELLEAMEGL